MTNTIREPRDSDFFPWLGLYEAYASARGIEFTEQRALLLWTWISDQAHAESALIALDESGEAQGFVHFHTFPRPLIGETGIFLDSLYASGGDEGIGHELFDAVRAAAASHGATVIRWTQAEGEQLPPVLAAAGGEPTTPAVFELQTVAQPA